MLVALITTDLSYSAPWVDTKPTIKTVHKNLIQIG
jgi:hypothetical protein